VKVTRACNDLFNSVALLIYIVNLSSPQYDFNVALHNSRKFFTKKVVLARSNSIVSFRTMQTINGLLSYFCNADSDSTTFENDFPLADENLIEK
jgi:hypothetical protein